MTNKDIESGLRALGLADEGTRHALSKLARPVTRPPTQSIETLTVSHTLIGAEDQVDAELESDS